MALTFGALTSDRVAVTASASIQNLAAFTVLFWCYPTTLTANRRFWSIGGVQKGVAVESSSRFGASVVRATTDAEFVSSTTLSTNTWQCLAVTWNGSAAPKGYRGTLVAALTEVSYASSIAGSGTPTTETADMFWANTSFIGSAFQGRLAMGMYCNTVLSLEAMRLAQFRMRRPASCVHYLEFGLVGTGTQPDWSGNGNTGTVTGATVSDHVPLAPLFGWTAEEPYVMPAVSLDLPARPGGILQAVHRASRF